MPFHRKVQMTGRSSYILTLPKQWIKKMNIQKNQDVTLIQQGNGNLTIIAGEPPLQELKPKIINIKEIPENNTLFHELIGAYTVGFTEIRIKMPRHLAQDIRQIVFDFLNAVIGLEIMEESDTELVIKDMMRVDTNAYENAISQMYKNVIEMLVDAFDALKRHDEKLALSVMERDRQIDRKNRHVARMFTQKLKDLADAHDAPYSYQDLECLFILNLYIELIGDYDVLIAKEVRRFYSEGGTENEILIQDIERMYHRVLAIVKNSEDAWHNRDISMAHQIAEDFISINKDLDKTVKSIEKLTVPINNIFEHLRMIAKMAENIAYLLIDLILSYEL
jgi:phosphate uptake regulator